MNREKDDEQGNLFTATQLERRPASRAALMVERPPRETSLKLSEVRASVLDSLGRIRSEQLRGPYRPYTYGEILRFIASNLPAEYAEYIRSANNLTRASLEVSIEKALKAREQYVRTGPRRRRRS